MVHPTAQHQHMEILEEHCTLEINYLRHLLELCGDLVKTI